jgi:hypothetical protein
MMQGRGVKTWVTNRLVVPFNTFPDCRHQQNANL